MPISDTIGPFVTVPVAMLDDQRCTYRHVRVYGQLALALQPATSGVVYVRRLAERSRLQPRAVRAMLDDLEAFGYIGRRRKPGAATWYTLAQLAAWQDALPELGNGIPTARVHVRTTAPADVRTSNADRARVRALTAQAGVLPPETYPRKSKADVGSANGERQTADPIEAPTIDPAEAVELFKRWGRNPDAWGPQAEPEAEA